MNKELVETCQRVLSYDDRLNLEHEIERQYKIKQGYDKMGLNWAFTDQDRRNMRYEKEEAVEWVLLLEAIPIIQQEVWTKYRSGYLTSLSIEVEKAVKAERERIKIAVVEAGAIVDHPTKSKRSLLILLNEFFKAVKGDDNGTQTMHRM